MSKLYPVGAATYSKHPSRYPCGTPRIATSARGAFVVGDDGQPYVDMTSGMGAVLLGHRHPYVDSAIRRQLNAGFAFPLPSRLEEGVAERLVFMLTWERAESVRFGKNGADVTTSAVRLARAMRPSRPDVLYCDYHGHNDWSMTEPPMNAGVYWNSDVSKKVPRDIDEIRGHAIADKPCAIVIESVSSVTAQPDPPGFWPALRALCDEHKMLLILDEIVTGFRMAAGGAAEVLGIEPDLACYGKAMANGLPLSAIVGPWDILKRYEDDVFFSLTHGGEALSLAAARATLECVCEYDVPHVIGALGDEIINLFREHDAPLSYGYPQRLVADFTDDQASALLRRRVLCAGYMNLTLAHAEQRVAREHLLESLSWVLSRT